MIPGQCPKGLVSVRSFPVIEEGSCFYPLPHGALFSGEKRHSVWILWVWANGELQSSKRNPSRVIPCWGITSWVHSPLSDHSGPSPLHSILSLVAGSTLEIASRLWKECPLVPTAKKVPVEWEEQASGQVNSILQQSQLMSSHFSKNERPGKPTDRRSHSFLLP